MVSPLQAEIGCFATSSELLNASGMAGGLVLTAQREIMDGRTGGTSGLLLVCILRCPKRALHVCTSSSRSNGNPPAAQSYSWLRPNPKVTHVPASVVAATKAKAPSASPDSENVRQFVNQASFQATPGTTLTTQQAGAASGPGQQEQGRRLAEVMPAAPPLITCITK